MAEQELFRLWNQAPKLYRNHVERPNLIKTAEALAEDRILAIVAPDGFGKTSFASEWYWRLREKNKLVLWASFSHIMLPNDLSMDLLTREISFRYSDKEDKEDSLSEQDNKYLFLDDFDEVPVKQRDVLVRFMRALFQLGYHVIVTSSRWCEELMSLRSEGVLVSLGRNLLRFDIHETASILGERSDNASDMLYTQQVFRFTDGWPAGIYLMTIEKELNSMPLLFGANRYIDAYFKARVEKLPLEIQSFYQSTAFLDELNEELCDFVLGSTSSGAMLRRLSQENTFINPRDNFNMSYCYENAFVTWLRGWMAECCVQQVEELNFRASDWYEGKGDFGFMAKHLLLAMIYAVRFKELEPPSNNASATNSETLYRAWISSMAPQEIFENPGLVIAAAWSFIKCGRPEDAVACLEYGSMGEESDVKNPVLAAHIRCVKAKAMEQNGEYERYIEEVDGLLEDATIGQNTSLRCMMVHALAEAYDQMGDMATGQKYYEEALALSHVCNDRQAAELSTYSIASFKYLCGSLDDAENVCLRMLEECSGAYKGLLYSQQAFIQIMMNRLDEAQDILEQANQCFSKSRNVDFLVESNVAQARLLDAMGNREKAYALAMSNVQLADRNENVPRGAREMAKNELVRMAIQRKSYREARGLLEKTRLLLKNGDIKNRLVFRGNEIRICIAEEAYDEARELLDEMKQEAKDSKLKVFFVEAKILEAQYFVEKNLQADAFLSISEALDISAMHNFKAPFLNKESQVFDLLNEAMSVRKLKRVSRRFCAELVEGFSKMVQTVEVEGAQTDQASLKRDLLTRREREILDLLNKGMTKKEIATELNISHNTVKVHVSNIYAKLDVSNKLDAFHASLECLDDF